MAINIFPSELSVGTLLGSKTVVARERSMTEWMKVRGACTLDAFIYSGFSLSPGAGLSVSVAAGVICINGYRVENDAAGTLSGLVANRTIAAPNFIWAQLDRDGNGLVTGYTLVSNITGTPPTDSVILGFAVTDAASVTSAISYAARPSTVRGSYTGDGTSNRFIFVGQFTPGYVIMHGLPYVRDISGSPLSPVSDAFIFGPVSSASVGFASQYSNFLDPDNDIPLGGLTTTSNAERPTITANGFTVSAEVSGTFRQSLNTSGDTYNWIAWV